VVVDEAEPLLSEDFKLLTDVESSRLADIVFNQILSVLGPDSMSSDDLSHLVVTLSSVLGQEMINDAEKLSLPPILTP
jgi:hypothetical protein